MTKFISKAMSLSLVVGMMASSIPVQAAYLTDAPTALETANRVLNEKAAMEGMVLLENKNQALPLKQGSNVALFGNASYATIKGGTGSGEVNNRYTVSIYEGMKGLFKISNEAYWEEFKYLYDKGMKEDISNEAITVIPSRWGPQYPASYIGNEHLLSQQEMDTAKAGGTSVAVYSISRISGEGGDRKIEKGEYYLSDMEKANLSLISKNFDTTIVVLNTGGIIDTSFMTEVEGVDGLFLMSQPGAEGGTAIAKLFAGIETPSGKITDTWAKKYEDYPASSDASFNDNNTDVEYYDEGIYVGYRYFDTFNITPAYAFGYGLSYTDFDIETLDVTADADKVNVTVKVTNTGSTYSGKEVVEVYFSAPDGALEKPYQELAAYGKTDLLAPDESQIMTISYDTADMSSYSEVKAAYLMEDGDYLVRVGGNSRDTKVEAVIHVDKDVITEQLANEMGKPADDFKAISAKDVTSYSYKEEAAEIAAAKKIALAADTFTTVKNASPYENETITTYLTKDAAADYKAGTNEVVEVVKDIEKPDLYDVYSGKYTLNEFVAQLDDAQLAHIVNGISGSVGNETIVGAMSKSVPGGAGETTSFYYGMLGLPNIVLADGPAGVRITKEYVGEDGKNYYQYCTDFPIGTLLAQTWNKELCQEVGKAIGAEMLDFGVTLWLAPGMNIHRDPTCGRNFEYYSEDPFVTGMTGGAISLGVQQNPGVGVTIKHFSGNNQEENRGRVNNWMTERSIREIYLRGFEIAVKMAQPMAIMTSYNKINGVYSDENYDLITDIARGEWGFDGCVMTDWNAGNRSPVGAMMHAGNDMIMPGGTQTRMINALAGKPSNALDTTLVLGDIQKCAVKVLNTVLKSFVYADMHDDITAVPYSSAYELKSYNLVAKSDIETAIDKVALKLGAKTLYVGGDKTSTKASVIAPASVKIASVTYTSSNKKVATVNAKGKVTAKKTGSATIKAVVKLADGSKLNLSQKINVKKASIKVTNKKASLKVKKTFVFKASVKGSAKKVTWSCQGRSGKITKAGKFTALKKGTVKITAKCGKLHTSFKLNVK